MCFPDKTGQVYTQLGSLGIPILAFVLGSLTFFIYRPTIYSFIILRFIDLIHKDNVRDILIHRYKLKSKRKRQKAEAFWNIVQESLLKEGLENVNLGSAGTQLLFMTFLFAFPASVYLIIIVEGWTTKSILMLVTSLAALLSAIASDYYLETIATFLLKSIEKAKIDSLAKRMGFGENQDEKHIGGKATGN